MQYVTSGENSSARLYLAAKELRRIRVLGTPPPYCSRLLIDAQAHKVVLGERRILLSALEFRLLHFLASHPGIVFSRDQPLDRVWGSDRNVTLRSVDVYVRRLREKTEERPGEAAWVQTVHGVGYMFAVPE